MEQPQLNDEGKTPKEAIEALMKVIGAEMPKFERE